MDRKTTPPVPDASASAKTPPAGIPSNVDRVVNNPAARKPKEKLTFSDLRLHDCERVGNGLEFVRVPLNDGRAFWALVVYSDRKGGGCDVISNPGQLACSKCGEPLETSPMRRYFRRRNIPLDEHLSVVLGIPLFTAFTMTESPSREEGEDSPEAIQSNEEPEPGPEAGPPSDVR